ncbi:hypothetical protein EV361DRAFT_904750, partial [Lentinula raphanica]
MIMGSFAIRLETLDSVFVVLLGHGQAASSLALADQHVKFLIFLSSLSLSFKLKLKLHQYINHPSVFYIIQTGL